MKVITRAEAIALGYNSYFSGKPCRRGHVAIKRVSGGCIECKPFWKIKPPSEVQRAANIAFAREWRKTPKAQAAEKARAERRRSDPAYVARLSKASFKSKLKGFGLTEADFDRMLRAQHGVCAICKRPERKKNYKTLCIDHAHATGVVRGLLCAACNTGLGMFQDSPELLQSAAAYARKYELVS